MTEISEIVESTASPSSKTTKTTRRNLPKSEAKTPECRQLASTWSTPSTIAIAQRLMLRNDLPLETIMLSFGSLEVWGGISEKLAVISNSYAPIALARAIDRERCNYCRKKGEESSTT